MGWTLMLPLSMVAIHEVKDAVGPAGAHPAQVSAPERGHWIWKAALVVTLSQ